MKRLVACFVLAGMLAGCSGQGEPSGPPESRQMESRRESQQAESQEPPQPESQEPESRQPAVGNGEPELHIEFQDTIHEELPPYSFAVTLTPAGAESDGAILYNAVIQVTDENGELLQDIPFEVLCENNPIAGMSAETFLEQFTELTDLNFDGYKDIYYQAGGYRNGMWQGCLWSPPGAAFDTQNQVMLLSASVPYLDEARKLVYTTETGSAVDHSWTASRWEGAALVKSREIRIAPVDGDIVCTEILYENGQVNPAFSKSLTDEASKEAFREHFAQDSFWEGHFDWQYYYEQMPLAAF